jgi:F0F1-type ATP synthase membrane subunit b/b'
MIKYSDQDEQHVEDQLKKARERRQDGIEKAASKEKQALENLLDKIKNERQHD